MKFGDNIKRDSTLFKYLTQITLRIFQRLLNKHDDIESSLQTGLFVDEYPAGADTGQSVSYPEQDTGYDYSDYMNPVIKVWNTFADRMTNFDGFFTNTLGKFNTTGGHAHTGIDGDGPELDAISITTPYGTVSDHLLDSSIHPSTDDVLLPVPSLFCDDFERTNLTEKWDVVSGSPSIVTSGNSKVLSMAPGNCVRIDSGDYTWNDHINIDFDLAFTNTEDLDHKVVVNIRAATSYDVGEKWLRLVIGTSGNSGIYEVTKTGGGETEAIVPDTQLFSIDNDTGWRHYRVLLYGSRVKAWFDTYDSTPSSHTEGITSVPIVNGKLDIVSNCSIYIDNFTIHRNVQYDVKDLSDYTGVITGGTSINPHENTHHFDGVDPLDIKDLADTAGKLLTHTEKDELFPGGDIHIHSDNGISIDEISPIGNNQTLLYDHVRSTELHPGATTPTLIHPPSISHPIDVITELDGVSVQNAQSDHFHVFPYWYKERLPDITYSGNLYGDNLIKNPSFEEGDKNAVIDFLLGWGICSNWKLHNAIRKKSHPRNGYFIEMDVAGDYIEQKNITVESNTQYEWGAWVMTPDPNQWKLDITLSNSVNVGPVTQTDDPSYNDVWTYRYVSFTVSIPAGITQISSIKLQLLTDGHDWSIDDTYFGKVGSRVCSDSSFTGYDEDDLHVQLIPTLTGEYVERSIYGQIGELTHGWSNRIRMRLYCDSTGCSKNISIPGVFGSMTINHWTDVSGVRTKEELWTYTQPQDIPWTPDVWEDVSISVVPGWNDIEIYYYYFDTYPVDIGIYPQLSSYIVGEEYVIGDIDPLISTKDGIYFVPVPLGATSWWDTFPASFTIPE